MAKGTREEGYYWAEKRREKQMKKVLSNLHDSMQSSSSTSTTTKNKKMGNKSKSGNLLDYIPKESVEKINEPYPSVKTASTQSQVIDEPEKPEEHDHLVGLGIIVDNRETQSAIVRHLALQQIEVILKTLPVADYVISDKVGIERKSASDFINSIKDGRLFDELYNLSQNFTIPILILEGNPSNQPGFSKLAILGAIASIVVNIKISILYTDSEAETADLLIALVKKVYQEKKSSGKVYIKKTATEAEAQEQIISGIPGINLVRAQELLTAFSNVENIFNADEDDLEKVSSIGKKTAKKIREIAEYDYNKEKK